MRTLFQHFRWWDLPRGGQTREPALQRTAGLSILLALLGGLLLAPPGARAQSGIGDVVYTVGTVARDANGQNWAYIVWQGTQTGLISNRVFAVYSKSGLPTNSAPYTRLSILSLQTDARVIQPLLRRAQNLGDDPTKLQQDLLQLFGSFMPASAVTPAEQLSAVIQGSLNNPNYYQNLQLLGRNHAGIELALGFADAELIGPGITTFEVRAFDPVALQDLAVIGRVSVEAGLPTILPPPGPPVLVPELSAMGDLNLKFRWGTPDILRRLGLMQFGYNVYRIQRDFALSNGWNTTNPPPLSLLSNLVVGAPAVAARVNRVPITPSALFTLPDAANLIPPGNTNTFFIMDDDGRGRPGYVNYGFTNGAQYFYYVAARDVLGRDGFLSPGLLATVCDRIPPYPPKGVHVLNNYQYNPVTMTSTQALQVVWNQNTQTNDTVTNYWVYRWMSIEQMNLLSGGISNNLIAVVPAIPGATNNSYLDDGAGSPTALAAYGETYYYSVRAGDAGACGQNLSGPGGPAFGVLRNRQGPEAATGFIEFNCLRPVVTPLQGGTFYLYPLPDDTVNYDLLLNCARTDPRFEWGEFYGIATYSSATGTPSTVVSNYFGPLFFLGNPNITWWWTPPRNPGGTNANATVSFQVWCRAALSNGKVSDFAVADVSPFPSDLYAFVPFEADAVSVRASTTATGDNRNSGCIEHDPGGGGGGVFATNNICVTVSPSPGSKEYRIYRRIDAGPLTLLDAGEVTNTAITITSCDNAPPANGGTMCFYVQMLDVNGNPGPMTVLGCIDSAPVSPLPIPVLAKLTATGNQTSPGMTVPWFCAPYGVQRFEVRVAGLPTAPNTNTALGQFSSSLSCTGAPPAYMTFTNFGTNLTLPFYSYTTPLAGPGFGSNGPDFKVPCSIELGKTYIVTVRALGKNGNAGGFSDFKTFVWAPPATPTGPQVPWPARGLPGTNANFLALGYYLSPTNATPSLRTASYTGNAILLALTSFTGRTLVELTPTNTFITGTNLDPLTVVGANVLGQSFFPAALYRYRVPTPGYPQTSGTTIQASPLMEKIAYQYTGEQGKTGDTIIQDPFVTATTQTVGEDLRYLWLWLIDTQPQISGAGYNYIVVHFGANHEIDQLIPSNEVDVP